MTILIEEDTEVSLRDLIPTMVEHINANQDFIKRNTEALEIYEGALMPHLISDMRASLSADYFNKIKTRLIPINILPKLMDKLSRLYATNPIRKPSVENEQDAELLAFYEKELDINSHFSLSEEYSHLHKGYSLEPFLDRPTALTDEESLTKVMVRAIPFDRFLPMNVNKINRERMDVWIKFVGMVDVQIDDRRTNIGHRTEKRSLFFAYSNEEFIAFDDHGDIREEFLVENGGINPFGIIPAMYGNRAKLKVIPTPDTDLLPMTKALPIIFSDLSGANMFLCFSVIWGLDVNLESAEMSPNAFWELKSDPNSDSKPQIGTIKPEVDSDKVLRFIKEAFLMWLDTKGVKAGAAGQLSVEKASGISKAIDEMDTTEALKRSSKQFEKDERKFWRVLAIMHNVWIDQGILTGMDKFSDNFIENSIDIEYDIEVPLEERRQKIQDAWFEFTRGILPATDLVKLLHPDWSEDLVNERAAIVEAGQIIRTESIDGETTESQDQDS